MNNMIRQRIREFHARIIEPNDTWDRVLLMAYMAVSAILLVIAALVLFGCSTMPQIQYITKEVHIRDTVVLVQPQVIRDTLFAQRAVEILNNRIDSVRIGLRTRGSDTVIMVRYYPLRDTFMLYAKPDTVHVKFRDTVMVQHTTMPEQNNEAKNEEESWLTKMAQAVGAFVILTCVIGAVAWGYWKR